MVSSVESMLAGSGSAKILPDITTNSKSIVFFSAQNEIFSIDTELYVGIRAEKLKCQKDFLRV